jgi:hypothetical protein
MSRLVPWPAVIVVGRVLTHISTCPAQTNPDTGLKSHWRPVQVKVCAVALIRVPLSVCQSNARMAGRTRIETQG